MTCRLHSAAALALTLAVFAQAAGFGDEHVASDAVQTALARAGDNKAQLSIALKEVAADQSRGMRFLIANMPQRDLETFSAEFLLLENVDPNKIFIMGYSHGGYGAFYIGPKMADRFAAVHVSAAAPTDGHASARNLRNTAFTFMVGEHDTRYGRLKRCRQFNAQVQQLRGKRTPVPRHVVWELTDATVKHFYWLHTPEPSPGKEVRAICNRNRLTINGEPPQKLHILLDERLIDYHEPLTIESTGKKVVKKLKPSLRTLCETLQERGDPEFMFTSRLSPQEILAKPNAEPTTASGQ